MDLTPEKIEFAAQTIRSGGLVAFPTETVYGLGGDATNAVAVARIFEVKRRPSFDPLIVHISDYGMLDRVASEIPPIARSLAEAFWPGPLTMILPKTDLIPGIVTSGLDTVGVRIPDHPIARDLITFSRTPIAAPSANRFGRLSPTRAEHVRHQLGDSVDVILDGGKTHHGVESTIVAFDKGVTLLRHGAIPIETLSAIAPEIEERKVDPERPLAPGGLAGHYAPSTRLKITDPSSISKKDRQGAACLCFSSRSEGFDSIEVLAPSGDIVEAAARLFDCLHRLDDSDPRIIFAEPVPEIGLGRAIMDRLRRAEAGSAEPPG